MPTRRTFLRSAALSLVPAGLRPPAAAGPAVTDTRHAAFDGLMAGFLKEHRVPGGALAVARNGKLVYARGFGLADRDARRPVRADTPFRIASVSKPLTAAAVLRLAEQRRVSLDAPVLRYVELEPHLAHRAESDPRWQKVTVRHCLLHIGGWDRGRSFDPIAVPRRIAAALGTKPPVPPEDVVRYMLGRRLDFDPGTGVAYSNLGYLLLGRVIEAASGQRYEAFVRDEVLAPLGVTAPRLGRALPEYRTGGEARYYDAAGGAAACLYPPRAGERVPLPDGGENFEAFEAHGGWVASAPDLVRFAAAFDDPRRCPILSEDSIRTMWARPAGRAGFHASGRPRVYYYGCGWAVRPVGADGRANTWHDGLIGGTSALLVRRHDGLSWAALFNTDRTPDGEVLSGVIDPLLHRAADEFVAGRGGPG